MADLPTSSAPCPNCGSSGTAEFCPECGQRQRSFRSSIWRIGVDLLIEVLDVDGRLWRTLRDLFLRPGSLPLAFSADRRASYVAPLRLYLFSSLLFFFLLALAPADEFASDVSPADGEDVGSTQEAGGEGDGVDPAPLFPYLNDRDKARLLNLLEDDSNQLAQEMVGAFAKELSGPTASDGLSSWLLQRGVPGLVDFLDEPGGYAGRVIEKLPIAMFVLLPFYALLLKLLFLNRGRFYAEHLVFALHLHVLAYLLFSLVIVVPDSLPDVADILGMTAFLSLGIYTWFAMRNYYGGRPLAVTVRFVGLGFAYLMLLAPALLMVMALTFIEL